MDSSERRRCRELAKSSSSVSRSLYSEIEEVGWEHLVHLAEDFKSLNFRIMDSRGRAHIMEIRLGKGHPQCQPSISADVPILFTVEWTPETRLKDLVHQFREHLEKLHEFWSALDEIDNSLRVVNVERPSRSQSSRKIELGDDCFILLSIDVKDPRSLPEPSCELVETAMAKTLQTMVLQLNISVGENRIKCYVTSFYSCAVASVAMAKKKEKTILENLEFLLKLKVPRTKNGRENDQQIECGICYSQFLPIDEEFGSKSGTGTDYTCDNSTCNKAFHSVCLEDWLHSITTTRQSFDVLFGNCPYCSEPVAVKINNTRH